MKALTITLLILFNFLYSHSQVVWQIDNAHSNVNFAVQWRQNSFRTGEFKIFTGEIVTIKENSLENASVTFKAQTSSIDLIASNLATMAQDENYLDTKDFPEIKFKSISIKKKAKDTYELKGILEIKGISNEVIFTLEDHGTIIFEGRSYGALKISGQILRSDYKIYGNDERLGDKIIITGYFETVKVDKENGE